MWAKCTGVWGKITPTKLAVFIKLFPTSEACMYVTLQDFTPDLQQIYTDISAISVTFRNSGYLDKCRLAASAETSVLMMSIFWAQFVFTQKCVNRDKTVSIATKLNC